MFMNFALLLIFARTESVAPCDNGSTARLVGTVLASNLICYPLYVVVFSVRPLTSLLVLAKNPLFGHPIDRPVLLMVLAFSQELYSITNA